MTSLFQMMMLFAVSRVTDVGCGKPVEIWRSEEWRLASFDVIHVVNNGHPPICRTI